MQAEANLDLPLLQHSVDPAQAVRRRVRHRVEALASRFQVDEGFGIGPALLRFVRSEDGVIDSGLILRAASKVVSQQFDDLIGAPGVEGLEAAPYSRMVEAALPLQQAHIGHVVEEGMFECVFELGEET